MLRVLKIGWDIFTTMEDIIGIHVKLRQATNKEPITGGEYSVKFFDKDLLIDDYLGISTLDDFGHAIISITRKDFRSNDSPLEKHPDIYFELCKYDSVIYKSPVLKNVSVEEREDFPASGGLNCNLGTYDILI